MTRLVTGLNGFELNQIISSTGRNGPGWVDPKHNFVHFINKKIYFCVSYDRKTIKLK